MQTAIRQQREALGLSRQQVAYHAECSLGSVQALEDGYSPRRSAVRERIEAALARLAAGAQSAAGAPALNAEAPAGPGASGSSSTGVRSRDVLAS